MDCFLAHFGILLSLPFLTGIIPHFENLFLDNHLVQCQESFDTLSDETKIENLCFTGLKTLPKCSVVIILTYRNFFDRTLSAVSRKF